jgi:DNA helicase-4
VKLDRTFRFNDRIASVSGKFIQKNPKQIRKTLDSKVRCASPQVVLHWADAIEGNRQPDTAVLERVIGMLKENVQQDDPSLLILSRYNHLLPDRPGLKSLQEMWPGEIRNPLTVHRSKGLEADYVIVNGLTANKYGFPSEIEDDPLLDLVLARPDSYPNAEERRLFYVALTRARHQVHLIVDRISPSSFALELINSEYDVRHIGRSADDVNICPECRSGLIVEKQPGFARCSNFPYCEFVAPKCSDCDKGFMLPLKEGSHGMYRCTNTQCQGNANLCPKCRVGAIIQKKSKYGDMLACHIWPRCDYIEKAVQRERSTS